MELIHHASFNTASNGVNNKVVKYSKIYQLKLKYLLFTNKVIFFMISHSSNLL